MKKKPLILPYNEKRRLHDRASRAQQKDQSEVCGVMTADRHSRIELHFIKNASDKAGSFSMSIADMKDARKKVKKNRNIIGSFHSHVVSEQFLAHVIFKMLAFPIYSSYMMFADMMQGCGESRK